MAIKTDFSKLCKQRELYMLFNRYITRNSIVFVCRCYINSICDRNVLDHKKIFL